MCELLGMCSSHPTDLNTSLSLFRPRGGEVGPHADGWGVAFYEDRAARLFKEPAPASDSACLAFLQDYGLRSHIAIAHIRRANPPRISNCYANTHPCERELNGRAWVFAHNGLLPGIFEMPVKRFRPIGDTDSEHAFCLLMDRIAESDGQESDHSDSDAAFLDHILPLVNAINELEEFNFLLSDGERVIAHAHTELHILQRSCQVAGCNQQVILVATRPLSDEPWHCLLPNTLLLLRRGELRAAHRTRGQAPRTAWERRKRQDQENPKERAGG